MAEAFFITGTDTGVGKTLIGAALLHAAAARGLRCFGLKPVASGALRGADGNLRNEDALALLAEASVALSYEAVNPVALEPAIAPHLAAREAGVVLDVDLLATHCRRELARPHDLALVEGAGGWRVPLNARETLADLARELALPVVLVVGLRLGCVNHALLSAEAIARDGLRLAGWVGTQVDTAMERLGDNLDTLRQRIPAPCLGVVPWRAGIRPCDAAPELDIGRLLQPASVVCST